LRYASNQRFKSERARTGAKSIILVTIRSITKRDTVCLHEQSAAGVSNAPLHAEFAARKMHSALQGKMEQGHDKLVIQPKEQQQPRRAARRCCSARIFAGTSDAEFV
jgi:hypothetical protein